MNAFALRFLFFALSLCSGAAWACECDSRNENLADDLQKSDFVFSGKVMGVEFDSKLDAYDARIKVNKIWKGELSTVVHVFSKGGKMCGYLFEKDQGYLVFASGAKRAFADTCGRTKKLMSANEELRQLGQPKLKSTEFCP